MQTRCPHCRQQVTVSESDPLVEICCPSCGDRFSLVQTATTTVNADQTRRIGHFELVEQLGQGAFGSVWKAQDQELDRVVAIKLPRREQLDEVEAERFLREARAAAQLHHPGIVSIHEVGRQKNQIYIVSDFVQGATLEDWQRFKPLSHRDAAQLVAAVAEALDHAHHRGVVHRDIKPANILIDGSGQPYLTDFGLAKREAGELTMTIEGQILGTPAYMSPEQARGEGHRVDPRSDIYSLGVILFQLLTGELPFRGNKRMLIMQIINDEPPSPRKLDAHVPRDLETITLKCLAKQRSRRFQTAAELAADLRRFLAGEAIHARPISRLERALRWCQRRPAVTLLSAAVVVLMVLLALIATRPLVAGLAIAVAASLMAMAVLATLTAVRLGRLARREHAARREAETNFRIARTAVDQMLTEVGQQWLSDIPQMEPVRKELLHQALGFYQQFVAEHPTDPDLLLDTARAHHRLGDILAMLAEESQAEQSYRESIRILRPLMQQFPDKREYAHCLAISFDYLAELFRSSGHKLHEAEDAYRESLRISQQLVDRFPAVPQHKQEVARARNNLGILLRDTGRVSEAEQLFRGSIQLSSHLAEQFPAQPVYPEELARTYINLGVVCNQQQQAATAQEAFERAIKLLEELARQDPASRDYRYKLAVCRMNLGNLKLRYGQRYNEAEAEYRPARDLLEQLTAGFPSIPQYREELARSDHCLASVLALSGKLAEAQEAQQQAKEQYETLVAQFPHVKRYESMVAVAWGGLAWIALQQKDRDRAEQCVRTAIRHQKAAVASNKSNPDYQFRLREHYAFMAEVMLARGDSDRAVATLAESVEMGIQTLDRLRSDVFEPLQSRDDFTQLVAQLETQACDPQENVHSPDTG